MPLALAGCVSTSISATRTSCSALVAGLWDAPVPDAAAPREGATPVDTLKNWIAFAAEQTSGKRTEYERAQAKQAIIERCEERDRQAVKRARPRFF